MLFAMFLSRPTPSPFTPATPVSPIPLSGTIDGVQASGPDLPLIANVAGNPVLAGGVRATTAARLILAAVAMGGLALPRYTTVALGSITSPPEGLLVWDDTLNVLKVYDGSAFVPVGGGSVAAADITDAGAAGIDVVRSSTFEAISTSLGLGDAAVRNTGIGPTNVILGNDTRLTNTRTPSSGSVNASTIDGSDAANIRAAIGAGIGDVPSSRTIAGLNLGTNRSVAEVQSALGLDYFVPLDANDQVRLLLTEPSGTLANSGAAGGVWTPGSGLIQGEMVHLSGGVRLGSGINGLSGSNAVEPASIALWAWIRLRTGAIGNEAVILGKPHSNAADPTWADPYWSIRMGLNSSRQIIVTVVKTADPIWPSRIETLGPALDPRRNYLVGLTWNGSRLAVWIDGDEYLSTTSGGAIAYGTAGVTPWVSGYVWSPSGDRPDIYVSALGICDTARSASWWREMWRRGVSFYR